MVNFTIALHMRYTIFELCLAPDHCFVKVI